MHRLEKDDMMNVRYPVGIRRLAPFVLTWGLALAGLAAPLALTPLGAHASLQNCVEGVSGELPIGGPGAALDVPLTHINASYVRSHFDAIEVRVPGAPSADEIVFILAMTTGPRIHARVGGLKAADISQWNGLR